MPKARPARKHCGGTYDAGTLWRMTRNGWTARCALWSLAEGWELRVTVDAEPVFSKRGAKVEDLFRVAEQWTEQMAARGWTRVTPTVRTPAAVA
jgi:hypothetical protein